MAISSTRTDTRTRIVDVATRLLREQGAGAVTTRAVAEAAGVQAPTIYRLFTDKEGLLEAVAEHVMTTYVTAKAGVVAAARAADVDPVEDLRAGWESQIAFGLDNPALYRLVTDWDRVQRSPAARSGMQVLRERVHRVALTGRLRTAERRAVEVIQAAGVGTVQTLLASPPEDRDTTLADAVWEGVLRQILVDSPAPRDGSPAAIAVALRAVASDLTMLSEAERHLLADWLDRIARDA